jgi:hypothetical protein
MQLEITRVFTPNYKDTGIADRRFNEDLQAISQSLEVSTIRGLAEFAKKKLELENAYGHYAIKITEAFIERAEFVKDSKDESNIHNWKGKVLMKTLRKGLAEIGFKPQHITKTIGAVYFIRMLKSFSELDNYDFGGSPEETERSKEFYEWSKSLSVSAQYELSNMEAPWCPYEFGEACPYSALQEISNNFSEPVGKKKLERIRQQYPKIWDRDNRGAKPNPVNTLECVPDFESLNTIAEQIVSLTYNLDTDETKVRAFEILKDTEDKLKGITSMTLTQSAENKQLTQSSY